MGGGRGGGKGKAGDRPKRGSQKPKIRSRLPRGAGSGE